MRQSLVAMAELTASWSEAQAEFSAALLSVEARWVPGVSYNGEFVEQAHVEVGPVDPITVRLREGLLLVHAQTSPFGPGYHQRVVEVLEAMGACLPSGWTRVEDTTAFWVHRDLDRLRRAFIAWALALWSDERLLTQARCSTRFVCLGLGEGPANVPSGCVATPTGFKGSRWIHDVRSGLRAALTHPPRPLAREAREAFLWWNRVPDAIDWIQLGRAICTSDVIWRPLAAGEDAPSQVLVREGAVACFESALKIDPHAAVPLEELQRLYALLDRVPEAEATAAQAAGSDTEPFQGGYREGWIRCPLAGQWNLQLPGWLRSACDAGDGHDVFWDDRMTVHVTATRRGGGEFSPEECANQHLEQLPPGARDLAVVEFLDGQVSGYLVVLEFGPDVPDVDSLVTGQVGRAGERVTFTVVARSPEASAMARRLGRSLRPIS